MVKTCLCTYAHIFLLNPLNILVKFLWNKTFSDNNTLSPVTTKITGPRTATDKTNIGLVNLLYIIMLKSGKSSQINPRSGKAQKFSWWLSAHKSESSFRDMHSTSAHYLVHVFGPWANPQGANGKWPWCCTTAGDHRTLNRENPSNGCRDNVFLPMGKSIGGEFANDSWHRTTTGQDNPVELQIEKIHPAVSERKFFTHGHIHRGWMGK